MKRKGFTLLGMLLVITVVMMMAVMLLVPGTARAEDSASTVTSSATETAVSNPFTILFSEILSYVSSNSVGVSGYYSSQAGEFTPALNLQLGTTKHKWLVVGADTPVAGDDNVLKGLGGYINLNLNKCVEKIKGTYPTTFESSIGYTAIYYFSDTGDIKEGWDDGLFGIFWQKSL